MYRQILVREEDCTRIYQHILWSRFPEEDVQKYQLQTVTYGVNATPFPVLRCLHQLYCEDGAKFPGAKGLLIYNTYVIDIRLLQRGVFKLKK